MLTLLAAASRVAASVGFGHQPRWLCATGWGSDHGGGPLRLSLRCWESLFVRLSLRRRFSLFFSLSLAVFGFRARPRSFLGIRLMTNSFSAPLRVEPVPVHFRMTGIVFETDHHRPMHRRRSGFKGNKCVCVCVCVCVCACACACECECVCVSVFYIVL